MPQPKYSSLREGVLTSIGDFLLTERFTIPKVTILKEGILDIINLISDYYEEGKPLFPEIIIVNDLKFLDSFIPKKVSIKNSAITKEEFQLVIKLCAPLAIHGWIIYIEVKEDKMSYGMVSAEVDETSPSIHSQTVGELKPDQTSYNVIYIRNIGNKVVELSGMDAKMVVSLNLDEAQDYSQNELSQLCKAATRNCNLDVAEKLITYFEKLFDETLKIGHGNLIGVVNDELDNIQKVKDELQVNGGIYLDSPIDFESLLTVTQESKDSQSSANLRIHATLFQAMLNHDGITIITNKGRVLGYHLLIADHINPTDKLNGGARSKAFLSMQNCGFFDSCFYKSQDGNLKFWKKQ